MRILATIMRRSAGLILLALSSYICHEVRADTRPSEEPDSAIGNTAHGEIEREPINTEDPATTGDDVWLISTRQLGCPSFNDGSPVDLRVSQYSGSGDWIESGLDELLDSESRQTVIYVHGNRVGYDEAIMRAWDTFGVLQADAAAPPLRLIIWSWPSDQIHGQIRDVRYKASRTNSEGQYLAWFLSQMDTETRVSLIGYSYGARIATGAVHVLGGGTLCGRSTPLAYASGNRRPIQVVLIAAALHNHWLSPGGFHDRFSSSADRLLVIYNSCDPLLKRYRIIQKRGRPVALGHSGAWGLDDDLAARTEQHDVCCSVGRTHRETDFLSSTEVIQWVQQLVLFHAMPVDAIRRRSER
ncbi:MAG: alpha/beta hydrolase [Pirellulaceae bacterium]|jgi:hypothetical protein|nr:alpha/beta hydrolase [Pirellulaceae bacterium]